jgi:hypothetical protein
MYGTVMVGKLAASPEDAEKAMDSWTSERAGRVPGFVASGVLVADDGTVVNFAQFASREDYEALAEDPEQDRWWRERFAPLLEGEPRWIDGEWFG